MLRYLAAASEAAITPLRRLGRGPTQQHFRMPCYGRIMSSVAGVVFAAAFLLLVAGVAKVSNPAPTQVALRTVGLPSTKLAAQALGFVEVIVAVIHVAVGNVVSGALIAALYLGFAVFSARLLRRSAGSVSCGCFGGDDTPVTTLHVWLNLVLAALTVASLFGSGAGLTKAMADSPWAGVPFLVFTLLLTWILQVAFTVLPALSKNAQGSSKPTGGQAAVTLQAKPSSATSPSAPSPPDPKEVVP